MNIVCQTWPDKNSIEQLRRFIYYGRRNCPAVYHVLYIGNHLIDDDTLEVFKQFDVVHTLEPTDFYLSLIGSDYIRTKLLNIFNLTEGLYLDTDIDILSDLNELPKVSNAEILYTLDPVYDHSRQYNELLKLYDLESSPPYALGGFLYLRIVEGLDVLFLEAYARMQTAGLTNLFIPGSNIWNVLIRSHTNYALDKSWHVLPTWCPQDIEGAKTLHWCGPVGHSLRPYIDYTGFNSGKPIINSEVQPCCT